VVTDGFAGNVLLKGLEAAYALSGAGVRDAPPRAAVLLGVDGTTVVCHGAATGDDLASGIALAAHLHRRAVVATLHALVPGPGAQAAASSVRDSDSEDVP
jgi:glycerol-3-phosphate acyltransferase PlsX